MASVEFHPVTTAGQKRVHPFKVLTSNKVWHPLFELEYRESGYSPAGGGGIPQDPPRWAFLYTMGPIEYFHGRSQE